jgi:DUF971 family protein
MERKKKRPQQIDLAAEQLHIQWQDGHQSCFDLEQLRRDCPCATCRSLRGEPGIQTEPAPEPGELSLLSDTAASATAAASGFDYVGRYGLRINWADGHNYGIYTFEALRLRDED